MVPALLRRVVVALPFYAFAIMAGAANDAAYSERVAALVNVGWNYPTPERQFEAWRASPGHDRNMLDARVERIGIGTDAAYVTMIACGK